MNLVIPRWFPPCPGVPLSPCGDSSEEIGFRSLPEALINGQARGLYSFTLGFRMDMGSSLKFGTPKLWMKFILVYLCDYVLMFQSSCMVGWVDWLASTLRIFYEVRMEEGVGVSCHCGCPQLWSTGPTDLADYLVAGTKRTDDSDP